MVEPNASPLSPQQLEQVTAAMRRLRTIRHAAAVATFNAWGAAIFATLSLLFSVILFSWVGLIVGLGLATVSFNEFRGARMLRQLDVRGPRYLGFNQLGFLALIIGYCCYMIYVGVTAPNAYEQIAADYPQVAPMFAGLDMGMIQVALAIVVYGLVIVLSAVLLGVNAVYDFTRAKHLRAYAQQTPSWIRDLLQRLARL